MTIRAIHLGVGGRGRWPVQHFAERDDFESAALIDVNVENLVGAREVSGLSQELCFGSLSEALAAGVEADAVIVITPPDLHAGQCLESLRAGMHVLVEKPLTKDLRQARQIVDEAAACDLRVCVCQNARYAPQAVTINRLIREGVYGKPAFGLMTKFGWRARTHHSGADLHSYLWERAIHDFDAVRFMLDAEPRRVWGHSFNPPWSPYAGGAGIYAWVEFDNDATFGFLCTFASHGKGSSLRVDCEGGTIEPGAGGLVVCVPGSDEPQTVPFDDAPQPETVLLDGFRDYITSGVEPAFSGRRNLNTVGLVECAGVASERGAVLDFDEFMAPRA